MFVFILMSCVSVALQWSTPDSLVERHHGGQHQLMPPQLYEMTRLSPLHSVVYLERLLETRRRLGIERWLPAIYRTKDGSVFCLPGILYK